MMQNAPELFSPNLLQDLPCEQPREELLASLQPGDSLTDPQWAIVPASGESADSQR